MIRYKDKIWENFDIDPITAEITDKNGYVQKTYVKHGRTMFKGVGVYCIMAHTFLGYREGFVVHHLDGNKMNDILSNLVIMTKQEHQNIHKPALGMKHTEEWCKAHSKFMKFNNVPHNQSASAKQKIREARLGMKASSDTKEKMSASHRKFFEDPENKKKFIEQLNTPEAIEKRKNHIVTEEEHNRRAAAAKGNTNTKDRKYYTNGIENRMCYDCPGIGWYLGKTMKKK